MKLNRLTLIYLAIVTFAFVSVREILHSERFASFVSSRITQWMAQGIGGEVAIKQIRLELYPFGMVLENVSFTSPDIDVELARINVNYGLRNAFKSDIVIDEVSLIEGKCIVAAKKERQENIDVSRKLIVETWQSIYQKLDEAPFRIENIKLNRFSVVSPEFVGEIPNANLEMKKYIRLDAHFENFNVKALAISAEKYPDSIKVSLSADDQSLAVNSLLIQKDLASIEANGEVLINESFNLSNTQLRIQGPDDAFLSWYPKINDLDPNLNTYIDLELNLTGPVSEPIVSVNSKFSHTESRFLKAERIDASASIEKNVLSIREIRVEDREGSVLITSDQKYTLDEKILERGFNNLAITLNRASTNSILYFLEGKLDPLIANLSGQLNASLDSSALSLQGATPLVLESFRVQLAPGEPLLAHPELQVNNLRLDLDFDPFKLNLSGKLVAEETLANLKARIDSVGISGSLESDNFVFNNFKKIQGVDLLGEGSLSVGIDGPWENVLFDFKGNFDSAVVAGYNLGSIEFLGNLPLKQEKLTFNNLKGRKNFSRYSGDISLDLSGKPYALKINYDAQRATLNDLKEIIAPIMPKAVSERNDIQARFKTSGQVQVDFDNRPVKLNLDVTGDSLSLAGEYFDSFSSKIEMNAGRLNIRRMILQREGVTGRGQVIWDTDSDYLEYEFAMNGMSLNSFNIYRLSPLALEGYLDLDLYGSGLLSADHSLRATLALRDSTIKRSSVPNSKIDAYYSRGELTLQGELMEGLGRVEAFIPVKGPKHALIRVDVTAEKINPLVGLLSPDRMRDETLNGKAYGQLQASFPIDKIESADVKLDVRNVEINYRAKKFKFTQSRPLLVQGGKFQKWTLVNDPESDLKFLSSAKGDLGGNFSLSSNYTVPAEFFELVSDRLIDMTGTLDGRINLDWTDEGVRSFLSHNARDVQFRLKDIPGRFSNIVLDASYDNNQIILQNLSGNYGRGTFQTSGKVTVQFPYPAVSLRMNLSDISYPLFNRSVANFDSRLSLIGTRPPYLFSGQVLLQNVQLSEDVGTYLGQIGGGSSYERFIPNTTQSLVNQYVEVDLSVVSNNAIHVINPLMDVTLDSRLKLSGELMTPMIAGRVSGVPARSRISFKGHEFVLNKAVVDFDPATGPSKAIIDLTGRTSVAGYNIDLLVNGQVDQMNIALSSEPALPQDEIVSLLTLGITSDISRNLNEEDRRSITTMSLGGFLFDQLQLTRGLDSNLGLKVSLAPEFSSDEGNLIEEASSDTSTSRRLKTGTKLRVQSQLGKKTSVSFSSTLGGEVEQKQEMNVNYDFNRSWSVEGVYELKSSVEENQGDTQSLGADVKYRWSF